MRILGRFPSKVPTLQIVIHQTFVTFIGVMVCLCEMIYIYFTYAFM